MNWKEYWNNKSEEKSALEQVGRSNDQEAFGRTLDYLESLVQPNADMTLFDVCCGNGLVSAHFASLVKHMVGFDLSEKLIHEAKKNNKEYSNAQFYCASAECTSQISKVKADVVLLHFAFQYFESTEMATAVLADLKEVLKAEGTLILTDIPDYHKASVLYSGLLGKLRMEKHRNFGGGELGRFWKQKQLVKISEQLGYRVKVLKQPDNLPYSHYRFDLVLTL